MVVKNISEAKAELSRLIAMTEKGAEVLITRAGKPVARLVAFARLPHPRKPGALRGKIRFNGDFEFNQVELESLFDIR
jgi:prevent-host-death family protein